MKKFLLFVLALFGCVSGAAAVEKCFVPTGRFELAGFQKSTDDEFLYDADGNIYECDDEFCTDSQEVTMPEGHIWQGKTYGESVKYRCRIGDFLNEDRWERVALDNRTQEFTEDKIEYATGGCGNPVGLTEYRFGQFSADNEFIYDKGKVYECDNEFCKDGAEMCFDAGHYWKGKEIKGAVKYRCEGRTNWVQIEIGDKCVGGKIAPGPGDSDKPEPGENKKSCVDSRTTPEGKACCSLSPSVAKWENGQCVCVDTNREFSYSDLQGYCNAKGAEDGSYKCDDYDKFAIDTWRSQCEESADVLERIQQLEDFCDSGNVKTDEFNKMFNAIQSLVNDNCQKSTVIQEVVVIEAKPKNTDAERKKILAAENVLKNIESGFDVSVWKDADGKFNTARLASDSIAGVVLGTAGGLITSSVIKKHQVEDGFEDINCVIGGQSVAGWGDEFSVGVQ